MHKFDFKGKTAIVTGGAQGFGLDIAKKFLNGGAKVFIWDIDEKLLKSVVDEIKHQNLKLNLNFLYLTHFHFLHILKNHQNLQ